MGKGPLLALLAAGAALALRGTGAGSEPAPAADRDGGGRMLASAAIGGLAGSIGGHGLLILANPVVAGSPVGLALTGVAGAAGAAAGAALAEIGPPVPPWFGAFS